MLQRKAYQIGKSFKVVYFFSDDHKKIRRGEEDPVDEAVCMPGDDMDYVETDIPIDALIEEAPKVVQKIFGDYITEARASELVPVINAAVLEVQTDEDAVVTPELYPKWSGDGVHYISGDRVRYEGVLYKVLQPHTSQPDWTPDTAVSLFAKILNPDPQVIPVWEQPDSTNPYMTGDKVHYPTADDPVYESLIDNNVWSPEAYPAGWKEV